MAFSDFTKQFPKATLPLDLGELSYRDFQEKAHLLSDELMAEYIAPLEPELDEFTEVLPVAKISEKEFLALIYWKAGLLHNHYRLVTFDKKGNPIDTRVIAGSYVERGEVITSAANVRDDKIIYVVTGKGSLAGDLGNAADSSVIRLGFDDSGIIKELANPEDN